jgi:hypothetical protein
MIGLDQVSLGINFQVQIFFQPVQLDFELSNLLVQLRLQRLMVQLALFTSRRENLRPFGLEVLFPLVNLCGMHPKMTDQLVDRFVPFEGFERHSGFEFCTVVVPLCRHVMAPSDLNFRHSILS